MRFPGDSALFDYAQSACFVTCQVARLLITDYCSLLTESSIPANLSASAWRE